MMISTMLSTKNTLDNNDFPSQKSACFQSSDLDKMGSVFCYPSLNYLVMHGTLSPLICQCIISYSPGYHILMCHSCINYALYLLCLYERDPQPIDIAANSKENKNKIKLTFPETVQLNPQENEIYLLDSWSSLQ